MKLPGRITHDKRISRARFIRAGVALGVSTAGAPMLASCGNDETTAGTRPATVGTEGVSGPEVAPGEAIATERDVEANSSVPYKNARTGQPEVLVRLPDGRFVAYSAVCTHQGCTVAYNPDTRKLACPCHGGVFDPANGAKVVAGPPPRPLPTVSTELRDGKIFRA